MVKTTKEIVKKITYYQALGRRKSATCRVRLCLTVRSLKKVKQELKKGDFLVNWIKSEEYFPGKITQQIYLQPLIITDSLNRFIITATVKGGGKMSQAEALRLAIARALLKVNPEYRPTLKAQGFLEVDARVRERRKVGMGGKSRRKRQSPKR